MSRDGTGFADCCRDRFAGFCVAKKLSILSRGGRETKPGRLELSGFLGAVLSAAMALSCGSSHAILQVSAPSTVTVGVPFTATVTAMYQGSRDTAIDGPIHFTSTDAAASLPTLYVFTAADAGSHTFTNLLLMTPGKQTMTVSDYDATPIAGSVNITVTSGP